MYKAAVLTISDRCSRGEREDESGRVIQELLKKIPFEVVKYEIILAGVLGFFLRF